MGVLCAQLINFYCFFVLVSCTEYILPRGRKEGARNDEGTRKEGKKDGTRNIVAGEGDRKKPLQRTFSAPQRNTVREKDEKKTGEKQGGKAWRRPAGLHAWPCSADGRTPPVPYMMGERGEQTHANAPLIFKETLGPLPPSFILRIRRMLFWWLEGVRAGARPCGPPCVSGSLPCRERLPT